MRFESKRGQNEEKLKKRVLQFNFFVFCVLQLFLADPLALHFKDEL